MAAIMRTYYIDESGFTGEDLMSREQPFFSQATVDFTDAEAAALIASCFSGVGVAELKYSQLRTNANHRKRIVALVRALATDPSRAGFWMAHKEFAMVAQIVQWWVEPLGERGGLNLYKDGATVAMTNMIFNCLQGFWGDSFRHKVLLAFQRMIRVRSPELFDDCRLIVDKAYDKSGEDEQLVLRFLRVSFYLLGFDHLKNLPARSLDIALTGLVLIIHTWRARHEDYAEVVHDQSSNMSKQLWIWQALSSPTIQEGTFVHPAAIAVYPMKITGTRFGDSKTMLQLQICDVLAGASIESVKSMRDPKLSGYAQELWDAGIGDLCIGGMLPSADVTPEALGTKGWDGNVALEWITDQLHQADVKPPTR